MRDYEVLYIVRADLEDDKVQDIVKRVNTLIERSGGTVERTNVWGKRKLAYEVKKQLKGIYLYWQYLGTTGVVEEIERNLRMLDQVIRYYTVKVDENVDPTAKPAAIDDETFNKAASTVPDEEELATGAAQLPRFEEEDIPDLDDEFLPSLDNDLPPLKGKE